MMYTVYCGAINNIDAKYPLHIEDPSGETVLINCNLHTIINGAGDLSFTILPNHPHYNRVDKRMYTFIDVMENETIIWRGRVTSINKDEYLQKNVTCEGCMSFLADTIQRPKKYAKTLLRSFLNDLIANHNAAVRHKAKKITLGEVWKGSTAKISGTVDYESTLNAIDRLVVRKYGGIIEMVPTDNGITLNYIKSFDAAAGQKIEFGENLIDFVIEQNSSDVYTAIIPLGATPDNVPSGTIDGRITIASVNGGKDYLTHTQKTESYINDYGWIFKVEENSDIDSPSELLEWGQEIVDEMDWDALVLQVTAVDLAMINPSLGSLQLGQKVEIISDPHNIHTTLPVTEVNKNLSVPEPARYIIGLKQKTKISGLMR